MVRSLMWSVPLLGCALLALAKGEGTVPEESCTTSDWHVPEDEVRVVHFIFHLAVHTGTEVLVRLYGLRGISDSVLR